MALAIYFDGGSRGNPGPAAAGVVIKEDRTPLLRAGYFLGHLTNNQAEYKGLILSLQAAAGSGRDEIKIFCDSELVARQITGQYRVKSPDLKPLHAQAMRLLDGFATWSIQHIKRRHNAEADKMANLAMDAGRDVIRRDRLGTPASPTVAPEPADLPGLIQVHVTRGPGRGKCPAGCRKGRIFPFGDTVPADLCVDACAAVVEVVLALRDGEPGMPPVDVSCQGDGCNAKFTIKKTS